MSLLLTGYAITSCAAEPDITALLASALVKERSPALAAQGLPNKSIANRLGISAWTVATHLRRIFAKLGVTTTKRNDYAAFRGKPFTGIKSPNPS